MALHFRCPGCHLRMPAAPQIAVDRAHHRAGTAYVNAVSPADDTRSFPCKRCAEPIQRGKLVRGVHDERIPPWLILEAPVVASGFAYFTGWILDWGPVAGAIVGAIALMLGAFVFFHLHHDLIENRKLAQRKLPTTPFVLGGIVVLTAGLVAALGAGTWLYLHAGWLAAAGGVFVIFIVVMIVASNAGKPRRKSISHAEIAEQNLRQVRRP